MPPSSVTRVAILDDYQRVALSMADWSILGPGVSVQPFHDRIGGEDAVSERLRNFDVIVAMTDVDPRLRAGMNASARIGVDELRGVLLVPAAAVFQSGAASVVYAVEGRSIERRVITVVKRGRDQVVVSGPIREGEHVTLTQPDGSDR